MMFSDTLKESIQETVDSEFRRVREEHEGDFQEGWIAGATWAINLAVFYAKLGELKEIQDAKRKTKKDTA